MTYRIAAILFGIVLLGCGQGSGTGPDHAQLSVIDGFHAPEDIEPLPGGDILVVSEYGGLTAARSGTIKLLRRSNKTEILYPQATADGDKITIPWGELECGPPLGESIAPHGIHVGAGPGGKDQLLVVNHAKRESIEIFQIMDADAYEPSVSWRGCVVAPEHVWLNDVAALPSGGFVASHMTPRGTTVEALLEIDDAPELQGHVLEWTSESGWQKVAGTEGKLANGLQVSADGSIIYINYYLGDEVVAIERSTGKKLWTAAVEGPDNSSWTPDGKLLVASHRAELKDVLACHDGEAAFCGIRFGVVSIDPATGETEELFAGEGEPFGGATVAVDVGDRLYLGSFAGERVGYIDIPGVGAGD
ncbi:MAG: hypothetical protein HKP27_11305 [Myxococcales bacterium]|nr:hypothetical protein [Myxococcales bacterium]